ncbi:MULTISPECIES: hypothetical protein [Paraliobacillus]|uniref:hypothetical protein n=1 Tax=Paraliobacillus TaxID=200903 RepID=UPI000DD464C2|nr:MULTISPECIES: hypothetical protein [Paraliobacillus]
MNIKKWMIIGLSSSAVIIWIVFFIILIGRDSPELMAKQHTTSVREEVALSNQTNRFKQVDSETNSADQDMPVESMDEENQDVQLADNTNIDQNILYDFEVDNAVSIDELLAALNIGKE